MSCKKKIQINGQVASGLPVKQACFCMALFFALMLCFNGEAMVRSARLLAYGPIREFWLVVLRPVGDLSRGSGLSYLRRGAENSLGKKLNEK